MFWNSPDNADASHAAEIDAKLERGEALFDEQEQDMENEEVLKALSLDTESEERARCEQAEMWEREQEILEAQQDADYLESVLTCPDDLTPAQTIHIGHIFNRWPEVFDEDLIYTTDSQRLVDAMKSYAYAN